MKVLICGSFWTGSLEESYAKAFEQEGWTVVRFDWESREWGPGRVRAVTSRLSSSRIGRQLIDTAASEVPDLIVVIKGRRIPVETLRNLKRVTGSIPLVNFNPDSPWDKFNGSRELIGSMIAYDAHFTWSRVLIERFRLTGVKSVVYLPFGYDRDLHKPVEGLRPKPEYDAVFIGSYDSQRDKLLAELGGCRIAIWGNGWKRAKFVPREWIKGEAVYGAESVRLLNRGVAAINILRPQNAGSLNMRTFEIPATRNILLTNRTAEQEEFLHEGTEMLCYESTDELRAHLVALRDDAERAEAIREAAFMRIQEETYTKRVRQILNALDL